MTRPVRLPPRSHRPAPAPAASLTLAALALAALAALASPPAPARAEAPASAPAAGGAGGGGESGGALAGEPAPQDTSRTTPPAAGAGGLGGAVRGAQSQGGQAGADTMGGRAAAPDSTAGTAAQAPAAPLPFLLSWVVDPEAGLRADVKSVRWYGTLTNTLAFLKDNHLTASATYETEEYRKQDKTVEGRRGNLSYGDEKGRWFSTSLSLLDDWSEDRTVSTLGTANLIKRDYKNATLGIDKFAFGTGAVTHAVKADALWNDQRGSTLGQRNDFRERNGKIGLRSHYALQPGVVLSSTLYGERGSGERTLGQETNPSAAHGDSVGGRVYYKGRLAAGHFSAMSTSFSKEYLDYRRNVNGIVDTLGAGEKILQELERNDAVDLEWENDMEVAGVALSTKLGRSVSEDSFRASAAGRKERHADDVQLGAGFGGAGDSLSVTYSYNWNWDDQRYKGATLTRGRQIMKRRALDLNWRRDLFRNTDLQVQASQSLQQDIAENRFNDNDRDHRETGLNALMESNLGGFKARMSFVARRVEEIAIRSTRSSTNNVKDSYELRPSYYWPLASWLLVQQGFGISIQFTDYVFSDLPNVNQKDDYNKRGNLKSQVSIQPNQRLKVDITHDYNARFNATRTTTDASGHDYYSRDLTQRVSAIELALSYQVAQNLKIQGATERTKDLKTTYNPRLSELDRRGGEVWVGMEYNKSWGQAQSGRELSARVRKYNAYGPNVQPAYSDYWDADVRLKWRF